MEDGVLDDATLKLLQGYAASAAERLGFAVSVSANDGRALAVTITKGSPAVRHTSYDPRAYSNHEEAVRFIDRILEEAGKTR